MCGETWSLREVVAATGLVEGEKQQGHCCLVQDTAWFPLSGNAARAVVVLDQQPLSAPSQNLLGRHNISKYSAKQECLPLEF